MWMFLVIVGLGLHVSHGVGYLLHQLDLGGEKGLEPNRWRVWGIHLLFWISYYPPSAYACR
jgi:hypothetical protein